MQQVGTSVNERKRRGRNAKGKEWYRSSSSMSRTSWWLMLTEVLLNQESGWFQRDSRRCIERKSGMLGLHSSRISLIHNTPCMLLIQLKMEDKIVPRITQHPPMTILQIQLRVLSRAETLMKR